MAYCPVAFLQQELKPLGLRDVFYAEPVSISLGCIMNQRRYLQEFLDTHF